MTYPIDGDYREVWFLQVSGEDLKKTGSVDHPDSQDHGLNDLAKRIERCPNLMQVAVKNTSLRTLPESIGKLAKLTSLHLLDNQSFEKLPESLGDLHQLESFTSTSTNFQELPSSFSNLKLKTLFLQFGRLSALPESIGNLSNLTHLSLRANQLTSLPKSFTDLAGLKFLDISLNQISVLPDSIGNLIRLQGLDLSQNLLKSLPSSMGNLVCLAYLNVFGNPLQALPQELSQLQNLRTFIVSNASPQLDPLPSKEDEKEEDIGAAKTPAVSHALPQEIPADAFPCVIS